MMKIILLQLLQVGSGSLEKSRGSDRPKINGSDRILIPAFFQGVLMQPERSVHRPQPAAPVQKRGFGRLPGQM